MKAVPVACAALSAVLFACTEFRGPCPDGVRCDGAPADLQVDVANCGSLGVACRAPHASSVCSGGACEILTCEEGWADCDASAATGCETDLAHSATDCGACGRTCFLPNATTDCIDGKCQPACCREGWSDCDGDPRNGCEAHLGSSVLHCGECGQACLRGQLCAGGTCGDECASPLLACGAACVDPEASADHCGGCDLRCDLAHAAAAECRAGACAVAACQAGWADCDGAAHSGCEADLRESAEHCGWCGNACHIPQATAACRGGRCRLVSCEAGWDDCDGLEENGCETDLRTSTEDCGACGRTCRPDHALATCKGGDCVVATCHPGWKDCNGAAGDGCESDVRTSLRSCGECSTACPGGEFCVNGACSATCPPPLSVCRGACVDTGSDVANCGACGVVCRLDRTTSACASGRCQVAACADGWGDCDGDPANGCETNLRLGTNCGFCGNACPPRYRCVSPTRVRNPTCVYWPAGE